MALYLIGIGLWDKKDISVKGLEVVRGCKEIYLENYTSRLNEPISELEQFYGHRINIANRDMAENRMHEIINDAKQFDVAFLVIGDVFSATTHMSLFLEARKQQVQVKVIHNASILSAIGIVGLELYKFGKVTSIPFDNQDVSTPVHVYRKNQDHGLHTLFLFDLNPQEERFMQISEAAEFLMRNGIHQDTKAVAIGGVGSEDPHIEYGPLNQLQNLSKLPQCLIIPGQLHFIEEEALAVWAIDQNQSQESPEQRQEQAQNIQNQFQ